MKLYKVGHILKEQLRVLEAYDMTTEAVVTKLMCFLGQTKDAKEIRKLFYKTINYDILYTDEEQDEML